MVQESAPWRNITTGDGKAYSHSNWQSFWRDISGSVINKYASVMPDSGSPGAIALLVRPSNPAGRSITINRGTAIVEGAYYKTTSAIDLEITQNNAGNDRIDVIVLRRTTTAQTVRAMVIQGTPAGSPTPPTLTDTSSVKDFPLAEVRVSDGFSTVDAANITPLAVFLPSSTMHLSVFKNSRSADIEPGRAVELDASNDRSVVLCDDIKDFLGISMGRISAGDWGVVQTGGIGLAYFSASVTRSRHLIISGTDGVLNDSPTPPAFSVGLALDSISGSGFAPIIVSFFNRFTSPTVTTSRFNRGPSGRFADEISYDTGISPPSDYLYAHVTLIAAPDGAFSIAGHYFKEDYDILTAADNVSSSQAIGFTLYATSSGDPLQTVFVGKGTNGNIFIEHRASGVSRPALREVIFRFFVYPD